MRPCLAVLVVLFAGCAAGADPAPLALGNRIRVRIEGRGEVPSITTADYFLYLTVRGPDGTRWATRVLAPETAESEGMSLFVGKHIEKKCDLPDVELTETLHGDRSCCEDIVLAPGYTLCFDPGSYYSYRIVDRGQTMIAERQAEIRLGAITADGSRYVEVEGADGPPLERAADPPGWPLAGTR